MKLELLGLNEKASQKHPCFGDHCNTQNGRLHLPVSPACNIQCRFCRRAINQTENRPGVSGKVLQPEQAADIVKKALQLCPEITVAGIAGPGDTLATDDAIRTFAAIHKEYPDLIKCLSTNGLLLPQKAAQLQAVGVKTITVTVNAVSPVILDRIVSHVVFEGVRHTGAEGAEILIYQQLEGIRLASTFALVKVNTVLIPGVNDHHIAEIAKTVKEAGAHIYNIIPLIPQHEFANTAAPTCDALYTARKDAEEHIKIFRHCQHCRADAFGIPGVSDFAAQLYEGSVETFSHG